MKITFLLDEAGIARPPTETAFLVNDAGEAERPTDAVVLVRNGLLWMGRSVRPASKGHWEFVGGGTQENEGVTGGALREMREEAGLLPEHVSFLAAGAVFPFYRFPSPERPGGAHPSGGPPKTGKRFRISVYHVRQGAEFDLNSGLNNQSAEFDTGEWVKPEQVLPRTVPFMRGSYKDILATAMPIVQLSRKFCHLRDDLLVERIQNDIFLPSNAYKNNLSMNLPPFPGHFMSAKEFARYTAFKERGHKALNSHRPK